MQLNRKHAQLIPEGENAILDQCLKEMPLSEQTHVCGETQDADAKPITRRKRRGARAERER